MRFGILGCRHAHIEIFVEEMLELGHEFIGICEKEGKFGLSLADKYKVSLLENEKSLFALKPEIVGTSAVNNKKIDVIKLCDLHGVNVMVDKPLVTNIEDYKIVEDIISRGRIQIGLMLTERFNPPIYTLNEMIKEGMLGDLINITILKPHKLMEKLREPWHFSREENGGILIDLLIHDFDILRWFTGSEIEATCGFARKGGNKNHQDFLDSVQLAVRMNNGVTATLHADWWTPDVCWAFGEGRIFCTGTLGSAEIRTTGDPMVDNEPFGIITTKDKHRGIFQNKAIPVAAITKDFLARIEGNSEYMISHEDILKATYATLIADNNIMV